MLYNVLSYLIFKDPDAPIRSGLPLMDLDEVIRFILQVLYHYY